MSLKESVYTMPAADGNAVRAEQYGDFLENVLGLKIKEEYTAYSGTTGTIYWLDTKKTMGFAAVCATYSNDKKSGIIPYYAGRKISYDGSSTYTAGLSGNFSIETKIYYQKSKNGNVIYFRIGTDTNCKYVAAKDDSGDWYVFQCDTMYHKSGNISVTNGVSVSTDSLFTAVKMPTIISSSIFPELYKIISATSFIEANTIVSFKSQPYKVVSTGGASILPCFAFPVSD